jgi:CRISPR-associated protein Cmr2
VTKHLLAISIGPVQEFIAAARRTSDLAAGSRLLADIARSVVQVLADVPACTLIFPARRDDNPPNKVLVELPDGVCPKEVAAHAKEAAKAELRKQWDAALQTLSDHSRTQKYDIDTELGNEQIDRLLEFYAAWNRSEGDDYQAQRKRTDELLAARKNLRDFAVPPSDRVAPPNIHGKSPLDPAFECVLRSIPDTATGEKSEPGVLALRKTEYLDAISIVKRVRGYEEREKVLSTRYFARLHTAPNSPLIYDWDDEDKIPEKYPYFAVLVADGDAVGDLLSRKKSLGEHQDFSRTLVQFAAFADQCVRKSNGQLVYAGGDDVLALLPVRTAISCAQEIACGYADTIRDGTLSAGVAVVHYRQPLFLSLMAARDAERQAKAAGRNRLCLALHPRGGRPLFATYPWRDWENSGAWSCLATWTQAFDSQILTRGIAYEIRGLAQEFGAVRDSIGRSVPSDLLRLEAERIWNRKRSEGGQKPPGFPQDAAASPETLTRFADLLVAARFLTSKGEA